MTDFSKLTKQQLIDKLNEKPAQTGSNRSITDHESELEKIDKLSQKGNPHSIPFIETSDHTNVMLYTELNKRVGPLHPDNAKRTMTRWKKAGVQLYVKKRTDQQVEAFKATDEYKASHTKHLALRKKRRAQSSKGKTEKMVADVAAAAAQAVAGAKNG